MWLELGGQIRLLGIQSGSHQGGAVGLRDGSGCSVGVGSGGGGSGGVESGFEEGGAVGMRDERHIPAVLRLPALLAPQDWWLEAQRIKPELYPTGWGIDIYILQGGAMEEGA